MNKIKITISILLCIIVTSNLFSSNVQAASDTLPSGLSYSDIEKTIDVYVSTHQDTTAAVSIAIFNTDKILFNKAYGNIDMENEIEADSTTVYEWGSITKMLTWVSVMQLVEQGKIDLDTDIHNYLPKGFLTKLTYNSKITMKNLMNHNAGWQEVPVDINLAYSNRIKPLGETLKDSEPFQIYEPGTVTAYSNWGAGLAGYIVERVSGMKFYEYVTKNIFQPLHMYNTSVHPTLDDNFWVKSKRLAEKGYTTDMKLITPNLYYTAFYPCGMAMGTMSDLYTFAQALLSKSKCPLFQKEETLIELLKPTSYYATGYPENAHGLWVENLDGNILGHDGNMAAFSSNLLIDIKNHIGVVVMVNQFAEEDYIHGIPKLVFQNEADNGIRGSYTYGNYYEMGRTDKRGYSKIGSLLRTFKVTNYTNNTIRMASLVAGNMDLTGITDRVFDFRGMASHLNIDKNNHVLQIQVSSASMIERNTLSVYCDYIICFFAFLSLLYSLITLICKSIHFIIRKFNKKQYAKMPLSLLYIAVPLISIFFFISLGIMVINLFSGTGTSSGVLPHIIFCIIYLIATALYTFLLLYNLKKDSLSKMQKAVACFNAVSMLFIAVFITYWQQYCWWI
jgi:CubicO group peptidase (beta-lactamase class C family)